MAQERARYSREFKANAVRMMEESGRSAVDIAADLGVAVEYLYRWRTAARRARGKPEKAFPGHGRPRDEELAALKKENQRLRLERDILKKALGLFTPTPK